MFIHPPTSLYSFFFFNDTATTEIYPLSLHDALPIYHRVGDGRPAIAVDENGPDDRLYFGFFVELAAGERSKQDRKSTRLNSSHQIISYAVFCLKKKKKQKVMTIKKNHTAARISLSDY